MASLPPRPASQRRSSPRRDIASSSGQEHIARTNSFSAASEDSQTVLLNSPPSTSTTSQDNAPQPRATTEATSADAEPRKCWICFNDETEDDEATSEWRSPCPCVLVAHEKCLLDWIADMEAPSSRRRAGGRRGKILCPQCKSEIRLQRPRSVVVDTIRAVEWVTSLLIPVGAVLTVGSAAYSTLALIGRAQIYQVFGTRDALQILAPLYEAPDVRNNSLGMRFLIELRDHWRLHLGLPTIPTVLMLSRTTLADSFLPFLPLIFFVGSGGPHQQDELLQVSWPPSAAFTVAMLPYVRGIYNTYYERVWLPRERKWLKEIQPRADSEPTNGLEVELEVGDNNNNQEDGDNRDGDGDVIEDAIEVEVDFDIFADWNNGGAADNNLAEDNPPVPVARGPAQPGNAPQNDVQHNDAVPDVPEAVREAQAAEPRRNRIRREHNIAFSTTSLADAILGAVVFPSIAAAVGEALKYALPRSWITTPTAGKPTGFLQTKWGRSILGGCLFVGVKDAVMLYVRWKMAQNHRMRKVLDFDPRKRKERSTGGRA